MVGIEIAIDGNTIFGEVVIERTQRRKVGLGAREVDIERRKVRLDAGEVGIERRKVGLNAREVEIEMKKVELDAVGRLV